MTRILAPYYVARAWDESTAEGIQLNFERLFQLLSDTVVQETTAAAVETGNHDRSPLKSTYFELWGSGPGTGMVAVAMNAGTAAGTTIQRATPPFTDAPYLDVTTAVLNNTLTITGPTGTSSMMDLIWDFDCSFIIRSDATATGLGVLFVGISQGNINPVAPYNPAEAGCYFRFVGGTDPGWMAMCHDGTTLSAAVEVADFAASTRYLLRMRKVGATCYFSVNGGAERAVSSSVPVLTRTAVGPRLRLNNLTGAARHLYFSRCWGEYGT